MFDNNLWTQEAGTNAAGMNYGTLSPVLPVAWNPADISTAAAGAHHQQAAGDGNSFAVPPLKRWARVPRSIAGAVQRKPGPAAQEWRHSVVTYKGCSTTCSIHCKYYVHWLQRSTCWPCCLKGPI